MSKQDFSGKMKTKQRSRIFFLIAVTASFMAAFVIFKSSAPRLVRLHTASETADMSRFRIDKTHAQVYFKKDNEEIPLKEIAAMDGVCVFLRGRRAFPVPLALSGQTGIYSYIFMEAFNKPQRIGFSILQKRGKGFQKLYEFKGQSASYPLMQSLKASRKETLYFVFEGYGIVYFSPPIQYRLLPPEKRKTIILVAFDALRSDRIGKRIAGHSLTPNIDRFIQDSAYFPRAYAQSSWTLPSFSSLFTSRYEFNHRVSLIHPLDLSQPLLVETLASRFVCFGLHGGSNLERWWGFSRGFDYYSNLESNEIFAQRGSFNLFAKAVEILKNGRFPDAFFFLYTPQTHGPYNPLPEYLHRINPKPYLLQHLGINWGMVQNTFLPIERRIRDSLEELYNAEVLTVDDAFGRFIQDLKAQGLYDNAMIVLFADHGEEFFDHGGWAHSHSMYEELLRVPLIMKFPRMQHAGQKIVEPVELIDILPTVLDTYRIPIPTNRIDGVSLLPTIHGRGKPRHVMASFSSRGYIKAIPPKLAIIQWPYKLITNIPFSEDEESTFAREAPPRQPPQYELYNLETDPEETRNLAEQNPRQISQWLPFILQWKKWVREIESGRTPEKDAAAAEALKRLKSLGYL